MSITPKARHACALLALSISIGFGCAADEPGGDSQSAEGSPSVAAPAEVPPAVASVPAVIPALVARVNGTEITGAELDSALATVAARMGGPVRADQRDRVIRDLLDELVARTLLVQSTEKERIEVPEGDLDARMEQLRQQSGGPVQFESFLKAQGMTVDAVRQQVRAGIAVSKLVAREIDPHVSVTPEQVSSYYTANPDEFTQGESIRASHFLIQVAEGAAPEARTAARQRAAALREEALVGADFATLARENSDDKGSGAKGGDLGFFPRGAMVPAFEAAAFALEPGQISEVVESRFGCHVIRLTERRAPQLTPLDEIRERLGEMLKQRQRQERVYRARFLGHQFDDLGFVWQTIPKTTHEDAPGSTRRGESIPGVAPL